MTFAYPMNTPARPPRPDTLWPKCRCGVSLSACTCHDPRTLRSTANSPLLASFVFNTDASPRQTLQRRGHVKKISISKPRLPPLVTGTNTALRRRKTLPESATSLYSGEASVHDQLHPANAITQRIPTPQDEYPLLTLITELSTPIRRTMSMSAITPSSGLSLLQAEWPTVGEQPDPQPAAQQATKTVSAFSDDEDGGRKMSEKTTTVKRTVTQEVRGLLKKRRQQAAAALGRALSIDLD